jgi:hypothetical protein
MKTNWAGYLFLLVVFGCSHSVSPGATFLVGLNSYQDEMHTLGAKPELWPDRQKMAESLTMAHAATMGGSTEFNRLVGLDLRRREYMIALRAPSLKPERAREIQEELVTINEETDSLIAIVKRQVANTMVRGEQSQGIAAVATIGLLDLALNDFSAVGNGTGAPARSTQVGQYVVTDVGGSRSTVTTADGRTYRCVTMLFGEEGAGINCEPPGK